MMNLGGFLPFTLTDFPGHMAAIIFTQGCNLRCPFCHNASLLTCHSQSGAPTEEEVLAFLDARRGQLDGLVVTGGEPTLQTGLAAFLRRVKAMGYAVKLDTNGVRPHVLAGLLDEGLVDYVAMDVKAPLEHYERVAGVRVATRELEESIATISWSGVAHEFRTTFVEALLSRADLDAIRAMLPSRSTHRVQRFVPEHALDPALRAESHSLASEAVA